MDANSRKNVPFEIKEVEPEVAAEVMTYFTGELTGYVRAGPKGYFLPHKYKGLAASFYHMDIRPSDVFVQTYPRSGTTLVQELIWLVASDMDYEKAASVPLSQRFPHLEIHVVIHPILEEQLLNYHKDDADTSKLLKELLIPIPELLALTPSPRFVKTHLPLSLLPPTLLDTAKVVFVARDPRDVAVSFYHHNRLVNAEGFVGDFKTYWNFFIKDQVQFTPFFAINKEAWEKRHHPNILFLFYDELSKDLASNIRRVCKFLGKQYTDEQLERLCEHLHIDNFRQNKSVNLDEMNTIGMLKPGEESFIRKGKTGGWRGYFDAEMTQQAERWMADNMRDTDLAFPQ